MLRETGFMPERGSLAPSEACLAGRHTVGFRNFNLRIFNSRVSNPNKLIVDDFLTRCRISMCQGLGPKNTMKFRKSTARGRSVRRSDRPSVRQPERE